MLAGIKR